MAMVISIVNIKGGTGKTATAYNLGAALAEQGKKVLLVNNDPNITYKSELWHDSHNTVRLFLSSLRNLNSSKRSQILFPYLRSYIVIINLDVNFKA